MSEKGELFKDGLIHIIVILFLQLLWQFFEQSIPFVELKQLLNLILERDEASDFAL